MFESSANARIIVWTNAGRDKVTLWRECGLGSGTSLRVQMPAAVPHQDQMVNPCLLGRKLLIKSQATNCLSSCGFLLCQSKVESARSMLWKDQSRALNTSVDRHAQRVVRTFWW